MPVIVTSEQQLSPELQQGLVKLYDSSPEFSHGSEALEKGQDVLASHGAWYVGWFNGKAVAAIMASPSADNRLLHNIVVQTSFISFYLINQRTTSRAGIAFFSVWLAMEQYFTRVGLSLIHISEPTRPY